MSPWHLCWQRSQSHFSQLHCPLPQSQLPLRQLQPQEQAPGSCGLGAHPLAVPGGTALSERGSSSPNRRHWWCRRAVASVVACRVKCGSVDRKAFLGRRTAWRARAGDHRRRLSAIRVASRHIGTRKECRRIGRLLRGIGYVGNERLIAWPRTRRPRWSIVGDSRICGGSSRAVLAQHVRALHLRDPARIDTAGIHIASAAGSGWDGASVSEVVQSIGTLVLWLRRRLSGRSLRLQPDAVHHDRYDSHCVSAESDPHFFLLPLTSVETAKSAGCCCSPGANKSSAKLYRPTEHGSLITLFELAKATSTDFPLRWGELA